ncbi:hypothetical protein GYMLUDRAFT_238339 [Collybiopsis luxurians FD-317 M1]|nr:hypothetical protein GYMLUDRAFT_238339 [Collybiopsis luxurians FD-317 M1]
MLFLRFIPFSYTAFRPLSFEVPSQNIEEHDAKVLAQISKLAAAAVKSSFADKEYILKLMKDYNPRFTGSREQINVLTIILDWEDLKEPESNINASSINSNTGSAEHF